MFGKKFIYTAGNTLLAALVLSLSPAAFAKDAKIAIVRGDVLFKKSTAGKKAAKKLQAEFAARKKQIRAKQKKLASLSKGLRGATGDKALKKRSEFIKLQQSLKLDQISYIRDMRIRQTQELKKIQKKAEKIIRAIAKKEKYDMVLTQGIVYNNKAVDITNKVVSALDKAK